MKFSIARFLALATLMILVVLLGTLWHSTRVTSASSVTPNPIWVRAGQPRTGVAATDPQQLLAVNSLSTGHTEPVNAALFSPDGTRLATASADTLLRLWRLDPLTAQPRLDCTLYNFPHPIVTLAFSPDGTKLATGDSDGGLKLWNSDCSTTNPAARTPQTVAQLPGSLRAVAFSPDGKWLASGGADNQLRIWSLGSASTTPVVAYSFDNGRAGLNAVRWSPDGQYLAFGATNTRVGVVSLNRANPVSSTTKIITAGVNNHSVRSLAFSPDGRWFAAGNDGGQLFLYSIAALTTGDARPVLTQPVAQSSQTLLSLAFNPASNQLAVATSANTVTLWAIDTEQGRDSVPLTPTLKLNQTLNGHTGAVRSVDYSPDGRWLLSSSDDHTVRLWDVTSGQPLSKLGANLNYLTSVFWSADAHNLVTSGDDGVTRLWRPTDTTLAVSLNAPSDSTKSSAGAGESAASVITSATSTVGRQSLTSPDGQWLATAGDDGQVRIWSTTNLAGPAQWTFQPVGGGALYALTFSPDSQRLYTGGQAGYIEEWQLSPDKTNWWVAKTASVGRGLHSLAVSPNSDRLVSGSDDGLLRFWQPDTLLALPNANGAAAIPAHQGYIKQIVFNPQGTRLFSAGGDGRVLVWDSQRGAVVSGVQLGGPVEALAVAADGQTVAASLSGGTIIIYNSATSQPYFTIAGQGLTALGLAFAPVPPAVAQGSATDYRLAAVTLDGALQVWQLNPAAAPMQNPLPHSGPVLLPDPAGPFVQARPASDHLSLAGQTITLKGVNFYPHLALWGAMWQHWNGPQVAADLDRATSLGINCLRVLIPYGAPFEWTAPDGTPNPEMLNELDQLMAMAAQRHLRLLLTLFDFYGDFPNATTSAEAANFRYVDTLVGRYRDNPLVLGWDIHNEPDNYPLWQQGENFQALDWLERMAQRIRLRDPNHWLTVGFGVTANVTKAGPDGVSPLALEDAVALHTYDPPGIVPQARAVRFDGANHLPVFLEEYGWPSGPSELTDQYTEPVQTQHYADSFAAMSQTGVDGGIAWTLWDTNYESILHLRPLSLQDFGLLRLDGSAKPAATVFKAAPATSLALIQAGPVTNTLPPGPALTVRPADPNLYAQYFEPTGFAVPTPFKEYWNRMGGLASFGYPISPIKVERGYLVQYFERARFEYHPKAEDSPDYAGLDRNAQLTRLVELGLLGDEKLTREGRQFSRAAPLAGADETYYEPTGHNLGGRFRAYWQSQGGLARFGYPLSEEVQEVSATDGKTYLVQYFERATFEYHPENAGTAYEVELGQLGREVLHPPR